MSNILNSVVSQYEENTKNKSYQNAMSNGERLKKYFSTNLKKGESVGEKVFRILQTSDGSSPFKEQWCHEIQLDGKWVKLHCLKRNDGETCPLCEVEDELRKGTEQERKTANTYRARRFYIVKGIERGKEDDGPKFWRFRHNTKKQGILDKIVPIFTKKGDITDPETGRDLVLSLARDDNNYSKVTTIMSEDAGPLTDNKELMKQWTEDTTTFRDVYSIKDFGYLEIVAEGFIPYFDKEEMKWISKEEWEEKYKDIKNKEAEEEIGNNVDEGIDVEVIEGETEEVNEGASVEKTEVLEDDGDDDGSDEDDDDVDSELDNLPF